MRVLTGVRRARRAHERRADRHARCSAPQQPAAGLVAADDADQSRAAAERRDVVGGVAAAARHDLGRVVLEDQHRRLARDARDAAVDELVGHDVADDGDRPAPQRVDQREELRRIHPTASIKLLRIASARSAVGRRVGLVRAVAGAHEDRARARRPPARDVEPAVADHHRSRRIEIHLAAGLLDHARARACGSGTPAGTRSIFASGWCGQK